jgi:hypothetical protein
MKKFFFAGSLFLVSLANAQLVNNGATIVIQNGGSIFCAGNFTNTSGTITNDGKIEVQGNFANSGTYNSTGNEDSLIMSGSGNATLNSGGSMFRYLTINKAAAGDLVTLTGSITVGTKLDYLVGVLSTDYLANPSYAVNAPGSAVFNFAAGREIIGRVTRTGWANGSTVLFNGANMQMTTAGGTAPSDLTAIMLPQAFGGDPTQAEREVKRKFLFIATGGSGFTTDIRFPYSDAAPELNTNTEGNLVPWNLVSAEWNARLTPVTRDGGNNWVSTTGIDATSLVQEWKLADPRYTFNITARLRGPWNGTDMNANLTSVMPTAQPYGVAPFNYTGTESVGAIPNANVVDWVLVEHRKPLSGLPEDAASGTITGRKAGFLLRNGTVVDLDGVTPMSFDITKQGAAFAVVRHLNHLGVMSNSLPSNAAGTFANDYSVLANAYKNAGISSQPMVQLAGGSYGLWAGDANKSGNLAASDVNAIKLAISNGLSGYQLTDVNLTGNLAASDVNLSKLMISSGGQGSTPLRVGEKIKSHLPGTASE